VFLFRGSASVASPYSGGARLSLSPLYTLWVAVAGAPLNFVLDEAPSGSFFFFSLTFAHQSLRSPFRAMVAGSGRTYVSLENGVRSGGTSQDSAFFLPAVLEGHLFTISSLSSQPSLIAPRTLFREERTPGRRSPRCSRRGSFDQSAYRAYYSPSFFLSSDLCSPLCRDLGYFFFFLLPMDTGRFTLFT